MSGTMKSDLVDIEVVIKIETAKAVLVNDGKRDVWLPLSQVEMERDNEKTFVTMPEWLAIDKGLV
jgi:hypothetical protein